MLTSHANISTSQDKCPHDDIAVAICNEILTDPNAVDKVRLYARSLLMLELTPSNDYLLKSLQVLAEKMAKVRLVVIVLSLKAYHGLMALTLSIVLSLLYLDVEPLGLVVIVMQCTAIGDFENAHLFSSYAFAGPR